jgi:hypothetical protein
MVGALAALCGILLFERGGSIFESKRAQRDERKRAFESICRLILTFANYENHSEEIPPAKMRQKLLEARIKTYLYAPEEIIFPFEILSGLITDGIAGRGELQKEEIAAKSSELMERMREFLKPAPRSVGHAAKTESGDS